MWTPLVSLCRVRSRWDGRAEVEHSGPPGTGIVCDLTEITDGNTFFTSEQKIPLFPLSLKHLFPFLSVVYILSRLRHFIWQCNFLHLDLMPIMTVICVNFLFIVLRLSVFKCYLVLMVLYNCKKLIHFILINIYILFVL